jgi:hypothetical protein
MTTRWNAPENAVARAEFVVVDVVAAVELPLRE